jgi:hypothetical protein
MTETTLPPWQIARLAVLLDALDGVPISDTERRSLLWLAGFEVHTVENMAAVIRRARGVDTGERRLALPRPTRHRRWSSTSGSGGIGWGEDPARPGKKRRHGRHGRPGRS